MPGVLTTGDDVDDKEKSLSSVLNVLARLTLRFRCGDQVWAHNATVQMRKRFRQLRTFVTDVTVAYEVVTRVRIRHRQISADVASGRGNYFRNVLCVLVQSQVPIESFENISLAGIMKVCRLEVVELR